MAIGSVKNAITIVALATVVSGLAVGSDWNEITSNASVHTAHVSIGSRPGDPSAPAMSLEELSRMVVGLQLENAETQERLSSQSQQLSSHTAAIGDLKTQLSAANRKVTRLESELKDAKTDLAQTKRALAEARRERDEAQKRYEEAEERRRREGERYERSMRGVQREAGELRDQLVEIGAEATGLRNRVAAEEAARMQAEADRQEAERTRQANEAGRVNAEEIRRLRDLVREDITVINEDANGVCRLNGAQFACARGAISVFCRGGLDGEGVKSVTAGDAYRGGIFRGGEYDRRRYVLELAQAKDEDERARLQALIYSVEQAQTRALVYEFNWNATGGPVWAIVGRDLKDHLRCVAIKTADRTFLDRLLRMIDRVAEINTGASQWVMSSMLFPIAAIGTVGCAAFILCGHLDRSFTIKSPESLEGGAQQTRA